MTHVAVALSRRVLQPAATTHDEPLALPGTATPQVSDLVGLSPGRAAVVCGYADHGSPATLRRLLDLGFGVGETVEAVRRAPVGDPVVYRIAGYEAALRRTEASLVLVREG